jgi:hypothetical protein
LIHICGGIHHSYHALVYILPGVEWDHQQKLKLHSEYSEHVETQVRLLSIMQCTLVGNVLSKIVFISLRDFQTWYSIPKGV